MYTLYAPQGGFMIIVLPALKRYNLDIAETIWRMVEMDMLDQEAPCKSMQDTHPSMRPGTMPYVFVIVVLELYLKCER